MCRRADGIGHLTRGAGARATRVSGRDGRRPWREAVLLVASLALTGISLELAILACAPQRREDLLQEAVVPRGSVGLVAGHFQDLYRPDSQLGWIPTPRHVGHKWGVVVGTREHGIRRNGPGPALTPQVLVVGDSNTFGDEVADEDAWPAQLERSLGVGVLNAGVSSFGLDQMLLRAEDLLPRYRLRVLVVGLIDDSLARVGQAIRHGSPKPYFVVGPNGALELRHSPVPPAPKVPLWRQWLGRSYVVSFTMDRLAPSYWWRGTMREFRVADNDVDGVGQRLVERLVQLARRHQVGLCFVFIDVTETERRGPELTRLERWLSPHLGPSVSLVHSVDAFAAAIRAHPRGLDAYSNPLPLVHFNREGQRVIAEVAQPAVAALLQGNQQ